MSKTTFLRRLFFHGIFLFLAPQVFSAPRLQSATLSQGSSMARFNDAAAYLHWTIVNPDPESTTVTLQLEPDVGTRDAIYSSRILVGPKSRLEGRSLVHIGDAERYIISLIQHNQRVDKNDILIRPNHERRMHIALLNDGEGLSGYSEIAKAQQLSQRLVFSVVRHKNVPEHYSALAIYDLLLLYQPDLQRYNSLQKLAILDYVRQGGSIILCHAELPFKLLGTELEELLPYYPGCIRQSEGMAELRQAFNLKEAEQAPSRDQNGDLLPPLKHDFLEVLEPEQSQVIMRTQERALLCISQKGLGQSIGLCFDPFIASRADQELLREVWNTLLSYSNYLPVNMRPDSRARLNETLQQLQGYEIPSVKVILRIFLLYFLCAIVILSIFFHYKKAALGWLVLCLFGLLYTLGIFLKASRIAVDQPQRSFTAVTTTLWDGNQGASSGNGNLFAKVDCRPDLRGSALDFFLAPPSRSFEHDGATAIAASPLHITSDWKNISLERIALQQYRPRSLNWSLRSKNHGLDQAELPRLLLTAQGMQLEAWQAPEHLQDAQRAIMLLPSDIVALQFNRAVASSETRFEGMEADLLYLAVSGYIRSLNLPAPALCLLANRSSRESGLLHIKDGKHDFSEYDYHLEFVPLQICLAEENCLIPPELFKLSIPPRSLLRQHYRNGQFQDIMLQAGTSLPYALDFDLHPQLAGLEAEEIKIELDISNPGGRASFDVQLLDQQKKPLEADKKEGLSFYFKPKTTVLDPRENKIRALISLHYKGNGDNALSQRVNNWRIISCKLQMLAHKAKEQAEAERLEQP